MARSIKEAMRGLDNPAAWCGDHMDADYYDEPTEPAQPDTRPKVGHYTHGAVECIDAIRAALTPEEFRGYLKGNVIKYTWRERWKGGADDVDKLHVYAGWLRDATEHESERIGGTD